jgi:hypothetical protein
MIRKPVKSDKLEKPGKLVKELDVFLVSSGIYFPMRHKNSVKSVKLAILFLVSSGI